MQVVSNNLVIKVGGAFLQSSQAAVNLLSNIKVLQSQFNVVLVHGGGNLVEDLLAALNLPSEKIQGLRVTPKEHIGYVTGALAGTANKQLCALAIKAKLTPVGLSLVDGNICVTTELDKKLGAVGKVEPGDARLLTTLANTSMLPIISSIGADSQGNLLNVNADQAATVIAQLLDADLLLLSDVPGVLDGNQELVAELDTQKVLSLIDQQIIKGGMLVKVQAAQTAANSLGRSVTIASWKNSHSLLGLMQGKQVGSKIQPETSSSNNKESA